MTSTLRDEAKSMLEASGFHEHNMLVYPDLDTFRETYCMYASQHLQPKYNEIVLIASQYEPLDRVRDNLRGYGVDVEKHEKDGSLVIIDAVKGYQSDKDHLDAIKLCKSLVARGEKEGKAGVCSFGDMGSFFMYDRIPGMLRYEQSITPKPKIKLKAFCTYHAQDYANLTKEQKSTVAGSHYRKLLPGN